MSTARPWGRAAAWLAFLGPFFYLTYGTANWLAANRAEVGSVVFDWERSIPFIAWTILPYWSLNLFYAASVFICKTRGELDNHVRRLVTAQIIAVACFVFFPLAFTFTQPASNGLPGLMFDALKGFDKPFNQAPSLHIALVVILWSLYSRHLVGFWRAALHVWFVLIAVSVLTTYQHHFIDIPTGALLGWFCVWLWPDEHKSPFLQAAAARELRRWKLAGLYAAAAALLALLAAGGGTWLWLLWPAFSLGLVAAFYAGLGAEAFQKRADGRHSVASSWLLAPYLFGARLNSRAWTWRRPLPDEVHEGVLLGRVPRMIGKAAGPFAVLDLTAEMRVAGPSAGYANVPVLDLTIPEPQRIREAIGHLERLRGQGSVLVCCALGYSRSAAVVAAWLLATGRASSAQEAVQMVRAARPGIVLGPGHLAAIEEAAR